MINGLYGTKTDQPALTYDYQGTMCPRDAAGSSNVSKIGVPRTCLEIGTITDFERRKMAALRQESDREHEA